MENKTTKQDFQELLDNTDNPALDLLESLLALTSHHTCHMKRISN